MASSSSLASHPLKYDVFLNFRGEDTRRGFTSHLYAALRQKALQIFFDDDDLKRGEEIARSLPRAIQDSTVAILVFSKDYASSRWCLDELAKIIECHHSHGQIVIPVFYEIDPSHLRNQSDDVGAAFVKHGQNPMNAHKIPRWKDALTIAANLSGFDSKNFRTDASLVDKIVDDILKNLNQSMPSDDFKQFVGMDLRIKEIEELFPINPSETRILGIWGMGGVGKTTTAKVICHNMSRQFEGYCFVSKVRENAFRIEELQEELISKVLGEKVTCTAGPSPLLIKRLSCKKMLIVLDDVNNSQQIKSLIGDPCWFGSKSMILITGRDQQVFKERTDHIYEVKLLNDDDALKLFNKSAFKQDYPRDGYASLSRSFVERIQGNPLALIVLGSALYKKNYDEWESALAQLSRAQNEVIYKALQISYSDLNREDRRIFLDIACFFKHVGEIYVKEDITRKKYKNREFDIDIMKKIYKSREDNIDITLSVLADKCLIVVSKNRLNMHDLLQDMGKEIVRADYPYQRSRLWDPQDICQMFARNKAEAVETITLDLSTTNLNLQVLMKMPNLRFLNFYGQSNLHLSEDFDDLFDALQYRGWDKYPLESLPPSSLMVLQLSNKNIKQLWMRAEEDSLLPRVKYGIADGFWKLTFLSLAQNKSITHLPNSKSGFLDSLEEFDVSGSSNLKEFPEVSSSIKRLNLSRTAIKQVPSSSLEFLSKIEYLVMEDCKELESLPSNFFSKLTSLCELNLRGCSRFKMLPEILEPMSRLVFRYLLSEIFGATRRSMFLNLSETAIEKLPSFIGICNESLHIDMSNCSKLAFYPSSANYFSEDIFLRAILDISNCHLRELPENWSFPSFIVALDLSKNDFERIPATIKRLSRLQILIMRYCKRLLSLPELPSNVYEIFAQNCKSLQEIWTLKQLSLDSRMKNYYFNFSNCFKLDEDECHEVVNALLRNYTRSRMQELSANFAMIYPGNRIPKWVKYQNMGDSIEICLPNRWLYHNFLGFAFYLCLDKQQHGDDLRFDCHFGHNYHFPPDNLEECCVGGLDKEHMAVFVNTKFCKWVLRHGDFEGVAFFKFGAGKIEIIKTCGVFPLYAPNDKLKRSTSGVGSFHGMPEKRLKTEEVE